MSLDVDAVPIEGTWYRHIPHRGRVWSQADPPPDGRWQRGSVVPGFYLADSPDTVWAEWYRLLAELGLRPERMLPRNLWRFRVSLDRIADLQDAERMARVGLEALRPDRSGWRPFQEIGERLFADGWRGLVAPSAARPEDGRALCLFRTEERIPGVEPIPPPIIYRRPPVPPRGMRT